MEIGTTWNESVVYPDTASGRSVRILTPCGPWNMGPPYHGRGAFTADSRYCVLSLRRDGGSGLVRADLDSGELSVIWWSSDESSLTGASALHERSGWVVFLADRSLLAVQIESSETRTLIEDIGSDRKLGCPAWSLDGETVFITHMPVRSDEQTSVTARYERIHFATGERSIFWEDPLGSCNHVQVCPSNGDLLLIDRDYPPGYAWYGDYRATSRAWLLDHRTTELTELRPRDEWRFQMHTNFNHDGTRIFYHGRSCPVPGMKGEVIEQTPQYVGVCDLKGAVIWEYIFPEFFYGHVGSHTQKDAIIIDGSLSGDLICILDYPETCCDGTPRIEILARHGSTWNKKLGQASHPHPVMTPDGSKLLFARSLADRSEVCLLDLK